MLDLFCSIAKRYQEKYKKEAEQNEHSNESGVQSGTKAETQDNALVKDEDNREIKIENEETKAIKEEFKKETEDDEKIKEEIKDEPLNEKKEEELEPKSENKMENEPVQSYKQETKIEKEIGEENEPEINDEIEVEPIALRKSTRSSVRKMQQTDQIKLTPTTKTTAKSTPKSVKKSNQKASKKKSPKKKSAACVEYIEDELDDEDIEEEDDDEEFAPSPSKKKAPTLAKKKSGHQKKPNLSYTDISTYLDNLFSSNAGRKIKQQEKPTKSIFEETVLEGPRSCRLKSRVKYTFEDFDKSINQACGEEPEEDIGEPRPARATRRSTRLNEHFDSVNSEAESDTGSNSSEYKAKVARPRYKSESEEVSEGEAEESDEDFKSGRRKKRRNERANGKKAKNAKKRKTRSKYCDDSESQVEETEEEEEEAKFSDEEEYNQRYSRRKRRVYRELGDDESETISDLENLNNCKAKVRSARTKSKRRNYCESSGEEGAKEESPKSRIKKAAPSDQEECGDEVPAKKTKPIIKRPWSDEDSAESKSEKGTVGENGNTNGSQLNGTNSSENENKSQVVNEAPGKSTVENKPIVLPAQNFVPNTFIANAAPLVYYYCQPAHIQPASIIQMNGQIQNQMQPIVLMNIPSQSFIKPILI
ncbi:hypothetical protein BpHYR1_001788 [Brachionus plicatilis]|uniref:Uncharacterized protein n=1 Tax=Brachionus plicatilis TaxID=10195 RepID=A0A3M7RLB8_BRAPC|nr:hypothetical protein BpHYR1_001788 [Brachionus plicatilis]